MTSKWMREVARQRSYDVEWRFISLRLVNALSSPPGVLCVCACQLCVAGSR